MANIELDGVNKTIKVDSGDLTLDVPGDIILDGDGADVHFRDDGTGYLQIGNSSNDVLLTSLQSDKDMIFKGVDGGSLITALTLDMSAAGNATFNADVTVGGTLNASSTQIITSNTPIISFIESDQSNKQYQIGSFGAAFAIYDQSNTEFRYIIDTNGNHVFNEGSADCDFRVESNNGTHRFFVDGGNNVVIVGGNDGGGTVPVPINTNGGTDPVFQLQGANNANEYTMHLMGGIDAQNNPPAIYFSKSRSNTLAQHTILQNGDRIGEIVFAPADGVDRNSVAAFICADVDGTPGENDTPGRLEFHTTADGANTSTERMRILSGGQVIIGSTSQKADELFSVATGANSRIVYIDNSNASYSQELIKGDVNRAQNNAYGFLRFTTSGESDTEFNFTGTGEAYADGSWNAGGADYAEYFEWEDGNSSDEDRRGYSVVLDGNKIVKATDSDDTSKIIGVISAYPAVVGDVDIERWKQKHLKDDFGSYIYEDYTQTEWKETTIIDGVEDIKEHTYQTDLIPDDVTVPDDAIVTVKDEDGNNLQRRKVNPDWNKDTAYISRADRKEWDTVGLMGKLRLRKGQPTGTNWIKMRDISDTVEEWLVR